MNTLIITGGSIEPSFAQQYLAWFGWDQTIAADSGLEFCRAADILPDLILGDYDSAREETVCYYREHYAERMHTFPAEKDETDTELALSLALEAGADHITLLGATGTRVDHMLGSLQLLIKARAAGAECLIVDAHNRIRLLGRPEEARHLSGLPAFQAGRSASAASSAARKQTGAEEAVRQGILSSAKSDPQPETLAAGPRTAPLLQDMLPQTGAQSAPAVEFYLRREEQFGRYVSLLPFTPCVEGLTLTGFHYNVTDFTLKCGRALGVSNEIEEETAQISFREGLLLVIESLD